MTQAHPADNPSFIIVGNIPVVIAPNATITLYLALLDMRSLVNGLILSN